eukprot:1838411-Amphidinium_carterae.2
MTNALYGLRTSPKQWQEHLSTILQQLGFTRLTSDACLFANKQSSIYLMAYVDNLLVVGDNVATQQFLQQLQQHLELKHTTHLTSSTPLEFLGNTIELMDNGTINLSFSARHYNKILKDYHLEMCNPSTVPGNKKPPIAAQPLDKEQHSMYNTLRSQQRSLAKPQAYSKGTIHYKVILAPKVVYNEKNEIVVNIASFADSDWAGCNSTRKSTSGTIISLHFPPQKLNFRQWDKQELKHNTSNKCLKK